jgi:putative polyhydroxyalkanoate system protein
MSDINIKREHALGTAEVKTRIDKTAVELGSKFGVKSKWKSDNQLEFTGTGADGTIDVSDTGVEVKVKLGWLAKALKGKIEETINKTLDRELSAPK